MGASPLVSAVIPTRNRAGLLAHALESVLAVEAANALLAAGLSVQALLCGGYER